MKLVFPTLAYKEKAIEFINEFHKYGSEVDGSGSLVNSLRDGKTYESWLDKVIADIDVANVDYEKRVPAITYFYVREEDDRTVGMMNIRLGITRALNRCDLTVASPSELWIEDREAIPEYKTSPRVGIAYAQKEDRERLWRFKAK